VKRWNDEQRARPERPTVVSLDGMPRTQHPIHRNRTKRHHDPRPHDLQLPVEVFGASLDLADPWSPVARRSTKDRIRHVAPLPVNPGRQEQAVECLARATNEGSTLPVFVLARRLAENNDLGPGRAAAIDDLGSPRCQRATHAPESLATDRAKWVYV
jgi:hypothetical protein